MCSTGGPLLLETQDLFTQEWQPSRIFGESVVGFSAPDGYDRHRSNGLRYHIFDNNPDTEFGSLTHRFSTS